MGRNPMYTFLAFLIVEALIAAGFLTRDRAEEAQSSIEEILFYAWLAFLGLAGFAKVMDYHKHHVTKEAEVEKAKWVDDPVVKYVLPTPPVFTENSPADDAGTPPVTVEQGLGTNGLKSTPTE